MRAIGNGSRLSPIVKKIREMREERQQRKKANEKILPVKNTKKWQVAQFLVFQLQLYN